MNWRGIKAVMFKDLRVVARSKMIMLTMILVPLLMMVVIPGGFGLGVSLGSEQFLEDIDDFDQMLMAMPASMRVQLDELAPEQLVLTLILVYMFAPFFLIVPLMVSSVIAADSFVGERERKTLEALLYTPLTDQELLLAKLLSAWMAAVLVGVLGFVLYSLVVNGVSWPIMRRVFFPNWMWLALVFWVGPATAALGLGVTVLGSTRVKTFQEAYQMSGMLVVPVIALMLGQLSGVMFLNIRVALLLGLGIWLVDAVILWIGVKTFDRDALLSRL